MFNLNCLFHFPWKVSQGERIIKVSLLASSSLTISLLLDQLNNDDNDCDDEEGENENEDDETAMKGETELEVVPRDAKNNNEGKIFRTDRNNKIKINK